MEVADAAHKAAQDWLDVHLTPGRDDLLDRPEMVDEWHEAAESMGVNPRTREFSLTLLLVVTMLMRLLESEEKHLPIPGVRHALTALITLISVVALSNIPKEA